MSDVQYKIVTPGPGKIVLELDDATDRTKGGLYLPENARTISQIGTVIAVPPFSLEKPLGLGIQVGARVAISKYSGSRLIMNGEDEKFVVVIADDILAVLEPIHDGETVRV